MTEKRLAKGVKKGAEKAVNKRARENKGRKQRDNGVGLFVSDLNLKVKITSRKCSKTEKKIAKYVESTVN